MWISGATSSPITCPRWPVVANLAGRTAWGTSARFITQHERRKVVENPSALFMRDFHLPSFSDRRQCLPPRLLPHPRHFLVAHRSGLLRTLPSMPFHQRSLRAASSCGAGYGTGYDRAHARGGVARGEVGP